MSENKSGRVKVLWHGFAQVAEGAKRERTRTEKLESLQREKEIGLSGLANRLPAVMCSGPSRCKN